MLGNTQMYLHTCLCVSACVYVCVRACGCEYFNVARFTLYFATRKLFDFANRTCDQKIV